MLAGAAVNIIIAGVAYFVSVFAAGFVLGTVRVLVLEPRVGPLTAVLVETPLMLAVSWLLCGYWIKRFAVPAGAASRLLMGGLAFALLIVAETLLGVFGFGRSLTVVLAGYKTAPGAVGLAAQALFGLFPLIRPRLS